MESTDTKNTHKEEVSQENGAESVPHVAEQKGKTSESHYKDLYIRTNADFQNFKRRTEREKAEWAVLMQSDVIGKMLPFADELELAIITTEQQNQESAQAWLEGAKLILKNFKKTFTDMGIEEIVATGEFNPELHEALMQVDNPEHVSGHIVQVFRPGYIFKGKVIRHARVSVAK